jgi:hypothetical protein
MKVLQIEAQGQGQVVIRIEPAILAAGKGENFNITVKINNVPKDINLVYIEFKITWNSSILNGVKMTDTLFRIVTPPEEQGNIWKYKHKVSVSSAEYAYSWYNVSRAIEKGYAPIYGNKTIAIITLNALNVAGRTTIKFDVLKLGVYDPQTKKISSIVDYPRMVLPENFSLKEGYVVVGFLLILIDSPKNVTYNVTPIDLTFTISRPAAWIAYSLDGGTNVTIAGNTTINLGEGQHYLIIYANDTSGNFGVSDIVYFTVDVTPPVVVFSPPSIKEGIIYGTYKWNVTFNASESYDTLTGIASYHWDFGDGFTGKGAIVTHLYRKSGTYNVTLTVKDFAGNVGTKVLTIKLIEPADIPLWIIPCILIPVAWIAIDYYLLKKKFPKK